MRLLTFYTSPPDALLAHLARHRFTRAGQRVVVLPLSALPAPRLARLAALRLERQELLHDLETIAWGLTQFTLGYCLPDAGRENGLKADYDATHSRLRAVERSLAAQERGTA